MSQPTEKRADELKIGDYIHDGRGLGPVEIAFTLPHSNVHGDERVLVVTGDATVSYHFPHEKFPLATAAELTDAQQRRERTEKIATFRAMIDWLEEHPEIPLPDRLDGQKSLYGPFSQQLAEVRRVAELVGQPVQERTTATGQAVATVDVKFGGRYGASRYNVYASDDGVPDDGAHDTYVTRDDVDDTDPAAADTEHDGYAPTGRQADLDLGDVLSGKVVRRGLDPETPLDELPADFGADHNPAACECEDCDEQVEEAAAEQYRAAVAAASGQAGAA